MPNMYHKDIGSFKSPPLPLPTYYASLSPLHLRSYPPMAYYDLFPCMTKTFAKFLKVKYKVQLFLAISTYYGIMKSDAGCM